MADKRFAFVSALTIAFAVASLMPQPAAGQGRAGSAETSSTVAPSPWTVTRTADGRPGWQNPAMSNAFRHGLLAVFCVALSTPAMGQSASTAPRVNRRIDIRMVRLWRSTQAVLACAGSGSPWTVPVDVPLHSPGLQRTDFSRVSPNTLMS